ncbi:STYX-like protein [Mya arenaria]|uniref:STYX-like protein n=1 Tax=Mya arenaria TaxID=6604 RepID=A0ABY7FES5_MYAAR|nr:STYX-like protein [Mya arenaria]
MEHSTVDPKAIRNIDGVDWSYGMRREMQEIVPGLFLGPYAAAMKSKKCDLQNRGITHIVCIRQNIEANFIRANFPDTFKYLILDIADTFTENIIRFMSQEYEALCNARRSVLSGGTLPSGSRKRKFPSDPDDNISDTAMT